MKTECKGKKLVVIGGGEHAAVVIDAAKQQGWTVFGFVDCQDNPSLRDDFEVPYLGADEDVEKLVKDDSLAFILGVGSNSLREKLVKSYKLEKSQWATVIHPSAIISTVSKIAEGSVILAKSIVQPNAKIGRHAIINCNSLVEHDCVIGDFSHLAPGAILGGGVSIGHACLIGIGSRVRDHVRIDENCIVGTGAVVVADVPKNKTVVGVPALPIRQVENKAKLEDLCIEPNTNLHDAMEIIMRTGQMIAMVTDNNKLVGILTDGDVRKALLSNASMHEAVGKFMNTSFIAIRENISNSSAFEIMKTNDVRHLPVVDDSGKLIDMHCLSGVAFGEVPQVDVIIMAGGKGTRLLPLTENLPKPMVRVAGKPILEHIILHLISCQIREFNFAVNHLSEQISDYFKDGSQYGCKINYLHEDEPLGTGGALKLLKQLDSKPVLAMNGDLITQLDVGKMLKDHRSRGNSLTVGVRDYEVSIPYGVMKSDGFELTSVQEKPVEHYLINAGIYMMESTLIEAVPDSVNYPMTELIEYCLQNKFKVGVYLVDGDWVDVGQHNDLKVARGL